MFLRLEGQSGMKIVRTFGFWVFAVGLCLVGCGPLRGASLGSDARIVAYNEANSLVIHSLVDRRADRRIPIKEAGPPSCSPDGKWIVVPAPKSTLLLDRDGSAVGILPRVDPPIAWNPNSSEFVGCRNRSAVVVHIASRKIVRSYPLPIKPLEAIWLGEGRSMAFCSSDTLATVEDGRVHSLNIHAKEIHLAVNEKERRLIWVAIGPNLDFPDLEDETGQSHLQVQIMPFPYSPEKATSLPLNPLFVNWARYDLTSGTEIFTEAYLNSGLVNERNLVFSWVPSISPDGNFVVQVQIFDHSPKGELFKLITVERQLSQTTNSTERTDLQRSASDLSKRVVLTIHWSILHLGSKPLKREIVHTSRDFDRPLIAWSSDSRHIAFVMKNGSFVRDVGQ